MVMFRGYVIFFGMFVLSTLLFDTWQQSDTQALRITAWSMWAFSLIYTLLLAKREAHQIIGELQEHSSVADVMGSYFDLWNAVDFFMTGRERVARALLLDGNLERLVSNPN